MTIICHINNFHVNLYPRSRYGHLQMKVGSRNGQTGADADTSEGFNYFITNP